MSTKDSESSESNDQIISLDDLNCGSSLDILKNHKLKNEVEKLEVAGKTHSMLLDMTKEDLTKEGIDEEKAKQIRYILDDITEGLYTYKIVNDPIHGHFEIHPLCVKIIDTPEFQRLRFIKQMGGKYLVYPGASHNRFEHSLGVYYLAGEFATMLRKRQTNLNIMDKDILCVQIAGLCHDLGHGPFSHMFDNQFLPALNIIKKHEQLSVDMFDYLVEKNKLKPVFKKYGLANVDMDFVKELIGGPTETSEDWPYKGRTKEKGFLYEIVANKRNGIDVDKWDYFARDCQMLGIKTSFDHTRCMKFARVLKVDGQHQICFRDKEVYNLYEMFHTRNTLHKIACQHRVGNIIETMITEALLEAEEAKIIPDEKGEKFKISKTVENMELYRKLTDDIVQTILWSTDPKLKKSREILEKIQNRNLYKCVGETYCPLSGTYKELKETVIKEGFFKELDESSKQDLKEDIIVHTVSLDYGMKEENPIAFVRFYNKRDPSIPFRIPEDSKLTTKIFAEQLIRIYCKNTNKGSIKKATQAFANWAKKEGFIGMDKIPEVTPTTKEQDKRKIDFNQDNRNKPVPQTFASSQQYPKGPLVNETFSTCMSRYMGPSISRHRYSFD